MNIIIDFHNLNLNTSQLNHIKDWKTPEEDRPKILEFFEKHAPEVLKYQTAEEIENVLKEKTITDGLEILGTLGMYERQWKASWFETPNSYLFYGDYKLIRKVIDDYLSERKLSKGAWARIIALGKAINPSLLIGNIETKEVFSFENFPFDEIDLNQYTPLKARSVSGKWDLVVGQLIGSLYNELFELLIGKLKLNRCAADDCEKIFSPTPRGKEQLFCSERCRNRIAQKRLREKRRITV
jgi:hypothetical protein